MSERTTYFKIGAGPPSTAIVNAVAHVKGVDPIDIEPLGAQIDADSLDSLINSIEVGSVSFEIEGLEVTVDGTGEVEIVEPAISLHEELEDAPNTLFLERTEDRETCVELLSPAPYDQLNVLGVTFSPSPDEWIGSWKSNAGKSPAEATIMDMGETARGTECSSIPVNGPTSFSVKPIPNPRDIAKLGGAITNQIAEWEDNENQTVVCFHSVTDLLEHVDEEYVFKFLTMITSHLRHQGAKAHFHMDPTELDDKTVYLMDQVFDAIVEVNQNGDRTISS